MGNYETRLEKLERLANVGERPYVLVPIADGETEESALKRAGFSKRPRVVFFLTARDMAL